MQVVSHPPDQVRKSRPYHKGTYQVAKCFSESFLVPFGGNLHSHRINAGQKKSGEKAEHNEGDQISVNKKNGQVRKAANH